MTNLTSYKTILSVFQVWIIVSVALTPVTAAIHCLVVRPGYGLVSEKCPHGTVGCRIRISKDAVDFYEYSALYDRNQYVCVHKSEFDGAKASGCMRKKSGRVRCWCHGRKNCNTPEASKQLYEAFTSDDPVLYASVIKELDDSPPVNEFSASMGFAEPVKTTTTTTTSPHTVSVVKVPILSHGMARGGVGRTNVKHSATLKLDESDQNKGFMRNAGSKKVGSSLTSGDAGDVSGLKGGQTFSKSTKNGHKSDADKHKLRKHHHHKPTSAESEDKNTAGSKGSYTVDKTPIQTNAMLVTSSEYLTTIKPKVVLDQNNEVHVIHAGMQDRYDHVTDASDGAINLPTASTIEDDFPATPPPSADDLYDEDELNRMDAEYAQRQKEQNRSRPTKPSMRVLPQDTDATFEEVGDPQTHGEYDDTTANAPGSVLSLIILLATALFMP